MARKKEKDLDAYAHNLAVAHPLAKVCLFCDVCVCID